MRVSLKISLVPVILAALSCAPRQASVQPPTSHLRPPTASGRDVFLDSLPAWASGKRLGLITNNASVDVAGRSDIDRLTERRDVRLVTLFAFEHGIRGDAPAGAHIANEVDARTGLPVYSLYGEIQKPTPAMLEGVDLLLYDVQDVGARPYTRVSTMALSMKAAAERGIPFVVLDRPNPLGGVEVEGPVLEPAFASFVGMYPIPLRHGMTLGELARFYNERFGIGADLRVIPMRGWRRSMRFADTGLPWVGPSPNIRTLAAALLYPGTVLIEGTNLSEGRGTDAPFEQVGAPWLRADDVVREMTALALPGVRFESVRIPIAADARKYGGQTVPGVRLVVTDPSSFRPVRTAIHLIAVTRRLHPTDFAWVGANRREPTLLTIDRLAGTDRARKAIEAGTLDDLLRRNDEDAAAFRAEREKYLMYR
jgi:uncharacterized protein YbbC (DUF1343 family)